MRESLHQGLRVIIFALTLTYLLGSCTTEKDKKLIEFERYLHGGLGLDKPSSGIYFIIQPSCFECAKGVLEMISDVKCPSLKIICLGVITEKNRRELIRIVGQKELIYDKSNKASRYELGIEKGMFIHFQDGEALSYASYGNYEPIVVEYINTNCK